MSAYTRRTKATSDLTAQEFNHLHNAVSHRLTCGVYLLDVLTNRFGGNEAVFSIWARRELDASPQSVWRYIELARNKDMIPAGATHLIDVYRELGIDAAE